MLNILEPVSRVTTLPDVGAPASLLWMAALGLLVLCCGILAMVLRSRT